MNPAAPLPIAPGATAQLPALAAALGGGLVVALALWAGVTLWRRRAGCEDGPPMTVEPAQDRPAAALSVAGALLLLVLTLPATVAVRQLWPHPDLGWRLLARWLLVVVPPVSAWFGLTVLIRNRRREP